MMRTHHPLLVWLGPALVTDAGDAAPPEEHDEDPVGWRDHLRLFATAWAAGFLFFLVWIG